MPLLDFVGASQFKTSFTIGYALIKGEEEADYLWALQALKDSLGQYNQQVATCDRERAWILALKSVYLETEILFADGISPKMFLPIAASGYLMSYGGFLQQWQKIANSADENAFEDLWMVMDADCSDCHLAIEYLETVQLQELKEYFIGA